MTAKSSGNSDHDVRLPTAPTTKLETRRRERAAQKKVLDTEEEGIPIEAEGGALGIDAAADVTAPVSEAFGAIEVALAESARAIGETIAQDAVSPSAAAVPSGSLVGTGTSAVMSSSLPLGLSVAGLAIAGSGGGAKGKDSDVVIQTSTGTSTIAGTVLKGSIVLGPVIAGNSLLVSVYTADGKTLLAQNVTIDGQGKFTVNLGDYRGLVQVRVIDTDPNKPDYADEGTLQAQSLKMTLLSLIEVSSALTSGQVNALTTMVARLSGLQSDGNTTSGQTIDKATVDDKSKMLAEKLGLMDETGQPLDLQNTSPLPTVKTDTAGKVVANPEFAADPTNLSMAEVYGAVLAAISGVESQIGDADQAMQTLVQHFESSSSSGSSSTSGVDQAKALLMSGARNNDAVMNKAAGGSGNTSSKSSLSDVMGATMNVEAKADPLEGLDMSKADDVAKLSALVATRLVKTDLDKLIVAGHIDKVPEAALGQIPVEVLKQGLTASALRQMKDDQLVALTTGQIQALSADLHLFDQLTPAQLTQISHFTAATLRILDNVGSDLREVPSGLGQSIVLPDTVFNDARPTFYVESPVATGLRLPPGTRLAIYDGATLLGATTINPTQAINPTQWQLTLTSDLSKGAHSLRMQIELQKSDGAWVASTAPAAYTVTLDNTAPTISSSQAFQLEATNGVFGVDHIVTANDDQMGQLSYSLKSSDSQWFNIAANGYLSVKSSANQDATFLAKQTFNVVLSVTDTAGNMTQQNLTLQKLKVPLPNTAPIFQIGSSSGINTSAAYNEGAGATVLHNTLSVVDPQLAVLQSGAGDYSGTSLRLARAGGANSEDELSINATGASFTIIANSSQSGSQLPSGFQLQSGGQTFATFTSVNGELVLQFTGSGTAPTQALVNQVLSRISYANTSRTPPSNVTLAWSFSDGNTGEQQGTGGALSTSGTTTVNITAVNDPASITASANEDTSVTEAGGDNNATVGDPNAGGRLSVSDLDMGEDKFQPVAASNLAGTYGSFTFNAATGVWSYQLNNDSLATQGLRAGQAATETLTVKSFDGTSHNIVVNITGANDTPVVTRPTAITLTDTAAFDSFFDPLHPQVSTLRASDAEGQDLTYDMQSGEGLDPPVFLFPGLPNFDSKQVGKFGTLYLVRTGADRGKYLYMPDDEAINALAAGSTPSPESFVVTVSDSDLSSQNTTLTVNITGANDAPTVLASAQSNTLTEDEGPAPITPPSMAVPSVDSPPPPRHRPPTPQASPKSNSPRET